MGDSGSSKPGPKPEKPQPKRERIEKGVDENRKERGYDHDTDNPFLQNPDKDKPQKKK